MPKKHTGWNYLTKVFKGTTIKILQKIRAWMMNNEKMDSEVNKELNSNFRMEK